MSGELVLLAGTSNPVLFKSIESFIMEELRPAYHSLDCVIGRFSDGEPKIDIKENIRKKEVYILQSTCNPVGHNLLELCLMADACYRSSVASITAVMPYFGLARQDRKKRSREPISAACEAKLLKASGVNKIIALDLHCGQTQGFFDGSMDNLYARRVFLERLQREKFEDLVIAAPDNGAAERANGLADRLGDNVTYVVIDKRRVDDSVKVNKVIGDVKDKMVIMFDDICDTGGTLIAGAEAILQRGAKEVWALCTHAVLSGSAVEKISQSPIKKLIVTDTIPLSDKARACEKIEVIPVAFLIAQAIIRSFRGESISALF